MTLVFLNFCVDFFCGHLAFLRSHCSPAFNIISANMPKYSLQKKWNGVHCWKIFQLTATCPSQRSYLYGNCHFGYQKKWSEQGQIPRTEYSTHWDCMYLWHLVHSGHNRKAKPMKRERHWSLTQNLKLRLTCQIQMLYCNLATKDNRPSQQVWYVCIPNMKSVRYHSRMAQMCQYALKVSMSKTCTQT